MTADKAEKLGTLFLAVFSVGLAGQLASVGMLHGPQWLGAATAVLGAVGLAAGVRLRPRQELIPARVRARD